MLDAPTSSHARLLIGEMVIEVAAGSFESLDSLAERQAAQKLCFLITLVVRDDQVDGLAERFHLGVAEHPLGGFIPADDPAGQVLADIASKEDSTIAARRSSVCFSMSDDLAVRMLKRDLGGYELGQDENAIMDVPADVCDPTQHERSNWSFRQARFATHQKPNVNYIYAFLDRIYLETDGNLPWTRI